MDLQVILLLSHFAARIPGRLEMCGFRVTTGGHAWVG
jgi:hypothetical protein